MASSTCELICELKNHISHEKVHYSDSSLLGGKVDCNHDKNTISNQNGDEDPLDQQAIKKKNQSKQRYRRLKQKLTSLCCENQEKSLFKSNKQVSSSNKSRLLTLAIEFEKMTLNQTKDYNAIQSKLKQIHKIVDLKWENDLFILKQSRFVPAFSALLKKVPTFHKNQFFQAVKTIELGLKVLRIFSTVSSNRDYMISTNQLSTLNSCLSSFIGKEQKRLAIQCLNVLFQLLSGKFKVDSQQIAALTFQLVFFGQLARKLRQSIDSTITEQGLPQAEYTVKCLKYLYLIYHKCFQKYLQRPLYNQPQIPQILQFHLDALLTQLQHMLPTLLYDREQKSLKDQQLPICHINVVMYMLKLVNLCIHVNYNTAKKIVGLENGGLFTDCLKGLYEYARENVEGSNADYELQAIYSELIEFFGKICCESEENRKKMAATGLLDLFYNHPIVYIMDPKLKSLLIPSLCAVMDNSEPNMKKYLSQNSAQSIISYILSQKKRYQQTQSKQIKHFQIQSIKQINNLNQDCQLQLQMQQQEYEQQNNIRVHLTRKESVSSFNSYTTQCTQNSYFNLMEEDKNVTGLFFVLPYHRWEPLVEKLRSLDC